MSVSARERSTIESRIASRRASFVRDLEALVECPSVSMQPEHAADCRQAAEVARDILLREGGRAEIVETQGNPVVVGEIGEGKRTVTIYNHLDVQPAAEGQDGWTRKPFRFAEEGERFYGRGATDDKGPAVAALHGALLARELGAGVRVRFLWELEEEVGSAHFESFLEANAKRLATDLVVVSDTLWLAPGKPAVPYGLRGLCAARLVLETAEKDAHSGVTGGAARNPIAELCEVIAGCHEARTGRITIEGFDKTWTKPSSEEVDGFLASGFTTEGFRRAHRLRSLRTDDPRQITAHIWASPTFEVHGIVGGYQGEGVKTVVPPRAEAKISFRLVPPQDPQEVLALLRAHVAKLNPNVQVFGGHGIRAYSGARRGPIADLVSDAFEFGFGVRPAFLREGGSIGAVLLMEEHLRAPVTFLGLSLPEHGYHGPDEFFDWGQAAGGMAAFARLLTEVETALP
jgi:acetylornithine deacetylase/succinyl-diaminopimelate desuccinylase-like protein